MIQTNSLIAGKIVSGAKSQVSTSPVDGSVIAQVNLLSEEEMNNVFLEAKKIKDLNTKNDYFELLKLADFLKQNRTEFINRIIKDSGFTEKDSQDLIDCSIEFCADYQKHIDEISVDDMETSFTFKKGSNQKIRLTSTAYGLISITTPRNTPLITELTAIIHGLWSGNIVFLRPSPGVATTVALLIEGFLKCFDPKTLDKLNIVFADARDFVKIALNYSNLLHYVGSTKYLEDTLIAGIKKGVKVLLDGDGSSMIIVDASYNVEEAAKACYEALIRCNGQICISVRMIIIEESIYKKFLSIFLDLINKTVIAAPGINVKSNMGPLFSNAQVENIIDVSKKYKNLSAPITSAYGANYISPVVIELEPDDSSFLKESVFGPIVGISSFKAYSWKRWLSENTINLTDAVFSNDKKFIDDFMETSTSPRKIINLDPTLESVFEPWGAFLPSGWNDVSYWYNKYRKYYQVVKESK